jgi:predicted nucleic acid-binding protein
MRKLEPADRAPNTPGVRAKVYLETTVVSYLTARPSRNVIVAGHQQITHDWWSNRRGDFDLFVSEFVLEESRDGDADAAARRIALLREAQLLHVTEDAMRLGERLISAASIPTKAGTDALHIAMAAVHGMDYLLTWNCRHIANASMRGKIEAACRSMGYASSVLCTPEELMG